MMMHAMTVPPLGYGYEMAVGMDGMCFMTIYDGGDRWAHGECDSKHMMCRSGNVDRSHMKRSPEEFENMRSAQQAKATAEWEVEDSKGERQQRKYYNRRGKVISTGPDVPMRLTGHIASAHQISKPSAKYPCD